MASTQFGQSGRQNLVTQERGQDTHWYSGGVNRFQKASNGWATTENYIQEEFNFTPVTTATTNTYGNTIVFELDHRGDKWVGEPIFFYTRGPITDTTDIGNGIAFCDYEGPSSVSQIRWVYNNKTVWSINGDTIVREAMLLKHREDKSRFEELVLGNLSFSERQALALCTKTIAIPIGVPWKKIDKAVTASGLPNKVRVEIDMQPYNVCTRFPPGQANGGSDGTLPTQHTTVGPTLSNIYFRQRFTHLKEATKNNEYLKTKSETPITHKINTYEYQNLNLISSGTNCIVIPLRNVKNNTIGLRVLIRKQADLNTTAREYHNYYLPYRVWLQDQGQPVTNYYYPGKINQMDNMGKMHPASDTILPFLELNFADFDWIESSDDGCYGGRTIGKYNNPELVVDFNAPTGTQLTWDKANHFPNLFACTSTGIAFDGQVDIESTIHNVIIEKKGDFRRYLL